MIMKHVPGDILRGAKAAALYLFGSEEEEYVRHIYYLVDKGIIPCHKGKNTIIYFRNSELDALWRNNNSIIIYR